MANEIGFDGGPSLTGATLYAHIHRSSDNQVYNGSGFEAIGSANWTTYSVSLSEAATSTGFFKGNFPVIARDNYYIVFFKQAGGSAAVTDLVVGQGEMRWSGTAPLLSVDVDSSGKVLLQATQSGVTIPTVTAITNAVTTTYQIKKNTALSNFEFLMTDSANHQPATGLAVTGKVSRDGAAFVALTNAVSEVEIGIYKVNLAAADVNANVLTLMFAATGADTTYITIVTQT